MLFVKIQFEYYSWDMQNKKFDESEANFILQKCFVINSYKTKYQQKNYFGKTLTFKKHYNTKRRRRIKTNNFF